MVRVNGHASVGRVMNVYPGIETELHVLYLHVEAPLSEEALWLADDLFIIEADWNAELGWMRFVSQQELAEIFQRCSVQGQFSAHVDVREGEGIVAVELASLGRLKPFESSPP